MCSVSQVDSHSENGSDGQSVEIEDEFIDVTPAPFFTRLERSDDRVVGRMKMFGCVFVLRRIAAADVSAAHAQTQMHPAVTDAQTVLAAFRAGRDLLDLSCVFAIAHIR
jgi:hypothetical protein